MQSTGYFKGEPQTLEMVLKARDERVYIQQTLRRTFNRPLVSYKLNMPGEVKYCPEIHRMFDAGLEAFRVAMADQQVVIAFEKLIYEHSGPEYFAVLEAEADWIKRQTVMLEEKHPLGRLFDMDVISEQGVSLSRTDFSMGPRKCLICEAEAFVCARARNHGLENLQSAIVQMYRDYFKK